MSARRVRGLKRRRRRFSRNERLSEEGSEKIPRRFPTFYLSSESADLVPGIPPRVSTGSDGSPSRPFGIVSSDGASCS
mgnify:FL=1